MPINYSYGPQGATLETDNPQAREIQQYISGFAGRSPGRQRQDRGFMPTRSGPGGETTQRVDASDASARIAENNARIAAAKALSEPAPMRSIRGGPGMIGGVGTSGLQLDTSKMTGAQRNALLPQSSAMAGIPPSGAALDASTLQPRQSGMPQGNDWYSLPDHVRKALLIQQGFGG
jgi:hypothetical protein